MDKEMIKRVAEAIRDSGEGCLSGSVYVVPEVAARAAIEAMLDAVLVERERCAEMVQPFTVQGGVGGAYIRRAAWSILDAIRATPVSEREEG